MGVRKKWGLGNWTTVYQLHAATWVDRTLLPTAGHTAPLHRPAAASRHRPTQATRSRPPSPSSPRPHTCTPLPPGRMGPASCAPACGRQGPGPPPKQLPAPPPAHRRTGGRPCSCGRPAGTSRAGRRGSRPAAGAGRAAGVSRSHQLVWCAPTGEQRGLFPGPATAPLTCVPASSVAPGGRCSATLPLATTAPVR